MLKVIFKLNVKSLFALLFIGTLTTSSLFAGGPWTLAKNKAYVQLGYNLIAENNVLFSTEHPDDQYLLPRAVTDQTIGVYAEYGVTDKFTVIASIPFKMVSNSDKIFEPAAPFPSEQGSLSGLGNIELTGKYQFYNKDFLLAGELGLSFPTGETDLKTRLSTGHETYGIQPGVQVGFSKNNFYSFANLKYNYRTDFTDEYKVGLELGYNVWKGLYTIFALDVVQSTEEQRALTNDFTYLYQDQQEYVAGTLKLSKNINENFGVNLHMTILTINANHVQKGPALGGSFYWKL